MSSIKIVARPKIYLDKYWQTPVITEKKIRDLIVKNPVLAQFDNYRNQTITVDYYAVPWATYIDIMTQNTRQDVQTKFKDVISELQKYPIQRNDPFAFTVCQHIYFRKIIPILKKIGIKILFTPHAEKEKEIINGVQILGLPLYPIHAPEPNESKEHLYSFIGAYNPHVYMTDIRKRILFDMKHPESAVVKNTNQWHFEKHVYREQMRGITMTKNETKELDLKKEFYKDTLSKSRYSLCPSGSGPNSIRLWESMKAGAIPIILSDTLCMPREKKISWGNAIIRVPENMIADIPEMLEQIDDKVETQLRENCIDIFNKICGTDGNCMDEVIRMEFRSYSDIVYDLEAQALTDTMNLLDIQDLEIRNLKIFTTHKNKLDKCPAKLKANIDSWETSNSTYRFKYYDDYDMQEWMRRHVDRNTYDNFESLNSGAGKADMFRICKLYYDGGVWVDSDLPAFDINQQKSDFKQIIHKHHTVLVRNRKCDNPRYTLIASKKNSDLLYHQINMINNKIEQAKNRNKHQTTIHVTGPFVLHELLCLTQKIDKVEDLKLDTPLKIGTTAFIYIDDIVPEKRNYQEENVYPGYEQDLKEMNVEPHSTTRSIK